MSDNGTPAGCHVSGIAHSLLGKVGKLGMKSLPSWCPPNTTTYNLPNRRYLLPKQGLQNGNIT